MPNILDYDFLLEGYNRKYRKNNPHKTVRAMLIDVYHTNRTTERAAEVLGISQQAFWQKLKKENIPRMEKGWRNSDRCYDAIMYIGRHQPIEETSPRELAWFTKYSISHVKKVILKHKLVCRDGRRKKISKARKELGYFVGKKGN